MNNEINLNPLYKFLSWFSFAIFVCFIGVTNVFAYSEKTIYSTVSNNTLSGQTYYNYAYLTGGGTQGISQGQVNTTISGVSYGFMFYMYENVSTSLSYTLVIYFMSNDLLNSFSGNWVSISSCSSSDCIPVSIISVTKNNNSGNSSILTIKYNPVSTGSYFKVDISGDNNQPLTGVTNFGIKRVELGASNPSSDIIDNQTENTNNIINNNNTNTNNIINNQNQNTEDLISVQQQNTQDIIDNQNSIAQQQQDQQMVCEYIDKSDIELDKYILNGNGTETSSNPWGITNYIPIDKNTKITVMIARSSGAFCFYNTNKTLISCNYNTSLSVGDILTIPANTAYIRFSINKDDNAPTFNICKNGNQAMQDTLTNDNVDSSSWANFFNNFTTNTFGLTSITTAPLILIQSITNTSCSDLQLPLPYLNNKYLTLPCMSSIYSQYFGSFFTLYQTITYGIIAYWVCVRIFNLVKDFKNPEHDEIEVVDL